MKVKLVPTLIVAGIALLIGLGFYSANANEGSAGWIMMVVSAIAFFVTMAGGFGIKYKESGSTVGVIALSVVCVIVHLVINLIATFAVFHPIPYIMFSGIVTLLFAGIAYALSKAL